MIDLSALREDTPGCSTKIHFNNAGASLMPTPVLGAMTYYLTLEAAQGGYETADLQAKELEQYYVAMASLLGSEPHNIAFTSSATSSFARALSSVPFQSGDTILIAQEDYISNQLAFLSLQNRLGVKLIRAQSLEEGGVDIDDVARLIIKHRPRLVSLSHIPTNTGLMQPIEAVGRLCKENNVLYLVDACQSAGQLPIDIKQIHCDFLSGTFRKFLRGPRGAGFLFVADSVLKSGLEPLYIDMRGANWTDKDKYAIQSDGKRFEEWEVPYALMSGARVAVDYALAVGLDNVAERNKVLCDYVRKKITDIGLKILDKGKNQGSIITVHIPGKKANDVLQYLRAKNINTSTSVREFAVIDFTEKRVDWALRISPHYYNTEQEVDALADALAALLKR
jgi:selenocysteine lyase/cysteine desulfurase